MAPWFLRVPERLALERATLEELSRTAPWLVGVEWLLADGLCVDAIIRAHGHDYELRVSFPAVYPDAPAVVRPRNIERRISSHQYGGADGPLCLEWGPDNWHSAVTVAQMLESTYRLFDVENPLGENRPEIPVIAPSRHHLTIGQELRGEWARWYASPTLGDYLEAQAVHAVGSFKFSFPKGGDNWIALIHEMAPIGDSAWTDESIPPLPGRESGDLSVGVWFKTDLDGATIGKPDTLDELRGKLAGIEGDKFLATDGTSPAEGFNRSIAGVLVVDRDAGLHLFVVLSGKKLIACFRVQSDDAPIEARSPEWNELSGKMIGIVGLGSAGSKIALSLARMGVRKFYLVDHDVLLPENLQRHALDWQEIGQHKVDAVAVAIKRIAHKAQVDVCRLHLGGQESNAGVSGALNRLATCDLLIDATASPRTFNLIASVARSSARPMVWLEIFGGGVGGLVARSRPNLDPAPQDMRIAYLQYCSENPATKLASQARNYAVEAEDDEVMVASDADIAVIAHHAARLVPDCFLAAEKTQFPYSMYLIGLTKDWVFEAPFATVPISMGSYPATGWNEGKGQELGAENSEFLLGLLQKKSANEAANTAGHQSSTG